MAKRKPELKREDCKALADKIAYSKQMYERWESIRMMPHPAMSLTTRICSRLKPNRGTAANIGSCAQRPRARSRDCYVENNKPAGGRTTLRVRRQSGIRFRLVLGASTATRLAYSASFQHSDAAY